MSPRHEDEEDSGSSAIIIGKVLAMLVLGGASCVLGLLPLKLSAILQKSTTGHGQTVLQLLLCFGGGALLCTTFLHLLPEVRESVEELQKQGKIVDTEFHLPEFIMCCGFFIMFLVEELIHLYLHHRESQCQLNETEVAAHRSLSIRRCSSISSKYHGDSRRGTLTRSEIMDHYNLSRKSQDSTFQDYYNIKRKSQDSVNKKSLSLKGIVIDGALYDKPDEKRNSIMEEMIHQSPLFTAIHSDLSPLPEINEESSPSSSYVEPNELSHNHEDEQKKIEPTEDHVDIPQPPPSISSYCNITPDPTYENINNKTGAKQGGHKMGHDLTHVLPDQDGVASAIRGLLVVLALSIHELFEGLAVGLQSTADLVYYMMGAVATHKLVISFCVGMELVSSGTKKTLIIIYIIAFAVVSPLGIGIGIAVSKDSGEAASEGVANVVLQGLATGTLLYVVFFEILLKEREGGGPPGLLQLLAILSGYGLMFGLLMAVSEGHEH